MVVFERTQRETQIALSGREQLLGPIEGKDDSVGIDRLVMLLTDQPSVRDVILFPVMKAES